MRKATISNTVTIILFILIIIVLFVGIKPIYNMVWGKSEDQICKISVLQHSALKKIPLVSSDSTEIKCPRKTVDFYDDHVEVNGDNFRVWEKPDGKKTSKFDKLDSYVVDQVLADQLYRCWDNMGAGKLDVFGHDAVIDDRYVCLICSQVSFKDISQKQTFSGLTEYLTKNNIPNQEITYMKYLNISIPVYATLLKQKLPWSQHIIDANEGSLKQDVTDFSTEKDYVIYFYAFKPNMLNNKLKAADNAYYIMISTMDDMIKRCEYIYN